MIRTNALMKPSFITSNPFVKTRGRALGSFLKPLVTMSEAFGDLSSP